jgi:hypothetical protein
MCHIDMYVGIVFGISHKLSSYLLTQFCYINIIYKCIIYIFISYFVITKFIYHISYDICCSNHIKILHSLYIIIYLFLCQFFFIIRSYKCIIYSTTIIFMLDRSIKLFCIFYSIFFVVFEKSNVFIFYFT